MKDKSFKEDILKLRKQNKSYRDIAKELGCAVSSVAYHCKRHNLQDVGLGFNQVSINLQKQINEYYKTHTTEETAKKFNIGITTVKRYVDNKRVLLTESEKKVRNYERVKAYRQRTKEKAVEYKGGKCLYCGYSKCVWAMEFHHKDPKQKDFSFAKYSNHAWKKIELELDKCIMLCSNCHRELHYQQYISKLYEIM